MELQVVGGSQGIMELTHARGEGLCSQAINHVWSDTTHVPWLPGGVVFTSVSLVKVMQEIHQPLITIQFW